MEKIIESLVGSGMTEEASNQIVEGYVSCTEIHTWNHFYTYLCHWCDERIRSIDDKDDLENLCVLFGIKPSLAEHFVVTGLIYKPEMIKSYLLLTFMKKSSEKNIM
jgi:hypothetical protein